MARLSHPPRFAVTEQAGPRVTLTANTSYSGGTYVNAGTLQVGNGGSTGSLGSGNVFIQTGATLLYDQNNSGNFEFISETITGTGNLTVEGNSRFELVQANTYSGVTTVDAGAILQVDAGGNVGTLGSGSVDDNDFTMVEQDKDSDSTTVNSTSAGVIPAFSTAICASIP